MVKCVVCPSFESQSVLSKHVPCVAEMFMLHSQAQRHAPSGSSGCAPPALYSRRQPPPLGLEALANGPTGLYDSVSFVCKPA